MVAKKPDPADLNKDGEVTPREQKQYDKQRATRRQARAAKEAGSTNYEPKADKLSQAELESRFQYAKEVIFSNPELKALWKQAIDEKWTDPALFQAKLRSTEWFQNNADYARRAWAAEQLGGADWQKQIEDASMVVQQAATQMGRDLTESEKRTLALRYIREGWGDPNRGMLMNQALSEGLAVEDGGFMGGQAGTLQQRLMAIAQSNGMKFSNGFYEGAARSVANGMTTEADWEREVRTQAASYWGPGWHDKIMGGMDMVDAASGYVDMMAREFEIDQSMIDLSDPYLTQALMHRDENGDPAPIGLWDFQQQLRNDPRWMGTKQAADQISNIGLDVARLMGLTG